MFIKRAAILFERGGVVEGTSYQAILDLGFQFGFTSGYICGFTDGHDNFIDRNTAAEIAKKSGQVPNNFSGPLYPEDLFPEKEYDCAS